MIAKAKLTRGAQTSRVFGPNLFFFGITYLLRSRPVPNTTQPSQPGWVGLSWLLCAFHICLCLCDGPGNVGIPPARNNSPPSIVAARKILAGALKPKRKYRREIRARAIENLPTGDFHLSGRGCRVEHGPSASLPIRLPHWTNPLEARQGANRLRLAREQLTIPTRLTPWGGPAQNDSQDVQWGKCKILRRWDGGRRHDLAAADGLWGRIGLVVSYSCRWP